ncbi:hypothetical protein MUP77_06975 [Candidatus Bathyarchaeota archaeon]|nr:hypothetical protein [Candidatus Bathyarchaeota archaeon]
MTDIEKAISKIVGSTTQIEWTELLKKLSSETGESVEALENDRKVYTMIKQVFKETKEGKVYSYTPKSGETNSGETATFIDKITKRRLTIPMDACNELGVWEGDQVKVTLEKIEKKEVEAAEKETE